MATIEFMPARLTTEETADLRRAVACLEGTSFAQRLTEAVGRPVGMLSRAMPQSARRVIAHASETALRGALKFALRTLDLKTTAKPANRAHKLAAAASGAVEGVLGLAALPVELPISTTILLRSIAEIAREEGEDLNAADAAFACVEVFALGGQGMGKGRWKAAISPFGPRWPNRSATARALSPPRVSAPSPRRSSRGWSHRSQRVSASW